MGAMNRTEQELVETHLYLIRPIILNTIQRNESIQGMGYDDLYQTTCEALCHAAQRYHADRGAAFPTFATTVVRNFLLSHCRQITRVQKNLEYLDAPVKENNGITYAEMLADEHQAMPDVSDIFVLSLLKEAEISILYLLYTHAVSKSQRFFRFNTMSKCAGHEKTGAIPFGTAPVMSFLFLFQIHQIIIHSLHMLRPVTIQIGIPDKHFAG